MSKRRPHANPIPRQPPTPAVDVVYVNPLFKLVFLTLLGMFCALLYISWKVSEKDTPNEIQQQLFTFSSHACELILGAIIGLLGGKAIDAFAVQKK